MNQCASSVLMIRPQHFGFNEQTAPTNAFQKLAFSDPPESGRTALAEFDLFAATLSSGGVHVLISEDRDYPRCPDAVFPNNWFTTHHDGSVVVYPMQSVNRRVEKRSDIFDWLQTEHHYSISRFIDFSFFEKQNLFLEGTGSMVFDHSHQTVYAAVSERTHEPVVRHFCESLNYEPVFFSAFTDNARRIYHTNVLLSISDDFVLICADSIADPEEKKRALSTLKDSGRNIILIDEYQLKNYCCNALTVINKHHEKITIMSQTAFENLQQSQIEIISSFSKILAAPIPMIENAGGGSVRCMMAEIFLPKK